MPTYYVAPYGSNSNNGTSPTTPWLTVQFALGAASGTNPGLVAGDTVWIAPGTYREVVTYGAGSGTSGNTVKIYGDPTFSRAWTSGSVGKVRITNFISDTALPTLGNTLQIVADYIDLQDLCIDGAPTGSVTGNTVSEACVFIRGGNISITRCNIQSTITSRQVGFEWVCPTAKNTLLLDRCTVNAGFGVWCYSLSQTAPYDINATIRDCVIISGQDLGLVFEGSVSGQIVGGRAYNNTIISNGTAGVYLANQNAASSATTVLRNNLIYCTRGTGVLGSSSFTITQQNNCVIAATTYTNVSPTTNTITAPMFDFGSSRVQNFSMFPWHAPATGSPLIGAGTATGAPTVDLYGNTWTGTPTIGAIESKTESDAGSYLPTERNASTITIAPGSTSQSIELYLGATGLTASTSGLSARYNRTRTASVSIPLVARTIAQAWTAGGFAEVDATNMPGVYRLDLPDAALAAGADDVTIVVRGASGTNGAVMTVKLSSGGLTEAQTASAVWGTSVAGYSGGSTFGGVVTETSSVVNGIEGEVQDVPSNVWEELRTNHTTVGTFGQYVNAELVTPVTSAALVRMGPFEVRADGLGASDPLDIQKGAQHGIDIQCVDNNNAGIDITSATVTAKVYNSGATLVDTYSCTATYAADGRAQFTIDTTVTNTPGTYTATITRTTGASDTQVFGPLRIYVRDI
jgi:hypothetical protein